MRQRSNASLSERESSAALRIAPLTTTLHPSLSSRRRPISLCVYGTLQASALEESNVDLTGELVNMITAQRVYQANAQTIKTQDQILQTIVNLR